MCKVAYVTHIEKCQANCKLCKWLEINIYIFDNASK